MAEREEDSSGQLGAMPQATAPDGTLISYAVTGTGPPLLLVSGQGSDRHAWDDVLEDFSAVFTVITFDHRGTGDSGKPASPAYSTRGFAVDALAVLDAAGIQRAHVYGLSMGGRVAQWLAIDWPQRVGALVLGCTSPGNAHGVLREAEPDRALSELDHAALLPMLLTPEWLFSQPEVLTRMAERASRPIPAHAQQLHYQASESHDAWDGLPRIQSPTLVIHGTADPINPPGNAALLAARIPGARCHLVEGGRHLFLVEFREESSRVVLEFLARHPL